MRDRGHIQSSELAFYGSLALGVKSATLVLYCTMYSPLTFPEPTFNLSFWLANVGNECELFYITESFKLQLQLNYLLLNILALISDWIWKLNKAKTINSSFAPKHPETKIDVTIRWFT